MPNQPLQPFAPPANMLGYLPNNMFSAGLLVEWFLFAVFTFWAIFTLIAIYHWLKYSHASVVTFPAIGVHLVISFVLATYALSGTILF